MPAIVLLDEIHSFEDSQNSAGDFFYAKKEFFVCGVVGRVESHRRFVTRDFPSTLDMQRMEVNVKVDVAAESLDESDGTSFEISYFVLASGVFFIEASLHGLLDRSCNDRIREPKNLSLEFGIACAHIAKGHRHREDPLANDGGGRKYVVSEVRSSFGHASCPATSAESSFFAAKSDEAFVFAIYAAEAQESVCQYAALEKSLEFLRHMLWKMFTLFAAEVLKAPQVFLHDFVEQVSGLRRV